MGVDVRKNATPELAVGAVTETIAAEPTWDPTWAKVPHPVIVVDADGVVSAASAAALALLPAPARRCSTVPPTG
jgi:hypothetical protein